MSHPAYIRSICFQLPTVSVGEVPEWIPYMPAPDAQGFVTGEDGRRWQLGTLDQVRAMAAAVRRKQTLDVNHAKEFAAPRGRPSPAYGYITAYEVRDDGTTWAKVDWNQRGTAAMQGRDYGWISPSFDHNKDFVIKRFAGATLTNDPNFTEMRGLNARETTEQPSMKKILAFLGLADTATEDEVVTKLTANAVELTRATNASQFPDTNRFVPRADYDGVLTRATNAEQQVGTLKKASLEKEVDVEIDAALKAGKITPATKDYHRATCMTDGGLDRFRQFVGAAPAVVDNNGGSGDRPAPTNQGQLTDTQRAVCRRMGVSEADYLKQLQNKATA